MQSRKGADNLVPLNPEIEKACKQNRRNKRASISTKEMANRQNNDGLNREVPEMVQEQAQNPVGELNNFYQLEGKSLYDAWERFKELQRKCPHHGLEQWMLVHNFYNGLCGTTHTIIDAAARWTFMSKSANEAHELLEDMTTNNHQWSDERLTYNKNVAGVHELDVITALTAQVASLTKQLQQNTVSANVVHMQMVCEICRGPHTFDRCTTMDPNNVPMDQAQVQAVENFQRPYNNPFSNTYNLGWRNHPNVLWRNDQHQQAQFQG
ncbi:hypothetical protein K7X08_016649 [Anisodus acutangulus]|uniref:Retrotransposon gag domain-containing protein n=1 Tax=Anisodus acutangulus TaxID=402998 RepID=A0A9Q1LHZ9_9SOLA|nr:hypothetical protein K7X08_016649 [Anisodus acutangulus]